MMLSPEAKKLGVITASAGNHALALAWHGKDLGIPVTCVMPVVAPLTKVDKCRKIGARVILHGQHIGEAKEYCYKEYPNLKYINGYDDPEIIAGAGSMGKHIHLSINERFVTQLYVLPGIEILEQVPDVDAVLVPVGGAGLIAGKPSHNFCRAVTFFISLSCCSNLL